MLEGSTATKCSSLFNKQRSILFDLSSKGGPATKNSLKKLKQLPFIVSFEEMSNTSDDESGQNYEQDLKDALSDLKKTAGAQEDKPLSSGVTELMDFGYKGLKSLDQHELIGLDTSGFLG